MHFDERSEYLIELRWKVHMTFKIRVVLTTEAILTIKSYIESVIGKNTKVR